MPSSTTTRYLPDVNVWLALAFAHKAEHQRADAWFQARPDGSCHFCRVAQQGFLRLSTNPAAVGPNALSNAAAWGLYDQIRRDPRVRFIHEPDTLEPHWRGYTQQPTPSTKLWTDAYLAAFAKGIDFELVSFDHGFRNYPGLKCVIL